MEFWLKQDDETLQLPIPPKEYTVCRSSNNETFKVENVGEVSFIGKTGLAVASIESFFPNKQYSFCQYSLFPKPSDCVALIERWQNSGKPIRYSITGTSVNMECTIENFEYKEQDGTGDIFFSLELKEYRRIILETISSVSTTVTNKKYISVPATKRVVTKTIPKTYTVKKGDTLSKISKMVYGISSKWREIANKNKLKNPNLIYPGQVLYL